MISTLDLLQEYLNQQPWRGWAQYLAHLPLQRHQHVLDLGCSVGCMSHLLAEQVKRVTGVDKNEEFIRYCLAFARDNQRFLCTDIQQLTWADYPPIDGVWASFALSYLPDPQAFLHTLFQLLPEGAWVACVDVACFISGNLPEYSEFFAPVYAFELQSCQSRQYDFNFGVKMEAMLQAAGFQVHYRDDNVDDQELNFDGPVSAEVLLNWHARLQRMQGLQHRLGHRFVAMSNELMTHLQAPSHQKRQNVRFIVARK